ncbi:hypothetical protein ACFYUY_13300 [Kitasatospora sp. NPDC004745]|uniref:hypothetical protein n=1 Tax=Kitasatospora sp. NPDC004745 TaxID=3364019 RepID=UPI0036CAE1FC
MTAHLSSSGPAGAHPEIDELADLAEGLVESADVAEALQRHLDGCAECRGTVEALGEVQALLGAVEAPPMPADVAARLDAALAVAAADPARTARPDAHRATPAAPSTTPPAAPSATPSAAARPAPPARSAAPTGPGRPRTRRRRRARLLLGAAAALAAIGLGAALLLPSDRADRGPSVTAAGPATTAAPQSPRSGHAASAGPVYREDQLAAQVQQLLAGSGSAPGLLPSGPGKPSAELPAEGQQELPAQGSGSASPSGCPAPAAGTPLATDHGSYAGAPVDLLVYPSPGRPGFADVYLRSPDCGPVVLQRTVPIR